MSLNKSMRAVERVVASIRSSGRTFESEYDNDVDALDAYCRKRFGVGVPADVLTFLELAPFSDGYAEGTMLSAGGMLRESWEVADYCTFTDEPLPCLVVATTYSGGPVYCVWMADGSSSRVVCFDHETASDREIDVVARSFGEFAEKFLGESYLNAIDWIDVDPTYEEDLAIETAAAHKEEVRYTQHHLDDPPTAYSRIQLFRMFHRCAQLEAKERVDDVLMRLRTWGRALEPHLVEAAPDRRPERDWLGQAGLAYADTDPEFGHHVVTFLGTWMYYPRRGEVG